MKTNGYRQAAGLVLLFVIGTPLGAQQAPAPAERAVPEQLQTFVPVTDEMLRQPEPENWISFRNGYNLWGIQPVRTDRR